MHIEVKKKLLVMVVLNKFSRPSSIFLFTDPPPVAALSGHGRVHSHRLHSHQCDLSLEPVWESYIPAAETPTGGGRRRPKSVSKSNIFPVRGRANSGGGRGRERLAEAQDGTQIIFPRSMKGEERGWW